MNIKFSNFIVINDGNLKEYSRGRAKYQWTENGAVIYPIMVGIPIIEVKSRSCVGLGIVTNINIDENHTTIDFEFQQIGPVPAKAYFDLYMQLKSMTVTESAYDSDVFIPGAMGVGKSNNQQRDVRLGTDDDDDGLSLSELVRMHNGY